MTVTKIIYISIKYGNSNLTDTFNFALLYHVHTHIYYSIGVQVARPNWFTAPLPY